MKKIKHTKIFYKVCIVTALWAEVFHDPWMCVKKINSQQQKNKVKKRGCFKTH